MHTYQLIVAASWLVMIVVWFVAAIVLGVSGIGRTSPLARVVRLLLVIAIWVAVGYGYVSAQSGINAAQDQLNAEQSNSSSLQHQLAGLTHVSATYSQVSAAKALIAKAMTNEIQWSHYLNDLSIKVPDDVYLTSVTATE